MPHICRTTGDAHAGYARPKPHKESKIATVKGPRNQQAPPRVAILGAPGDTGNLGVTALLHGTLAGLEPYLPHADITVFDNGLGARHSPPGVPDGMLPYRSVGLRVSRRFHRPESLTNIRISAKLGGLGNPAARALLDADAVLDISGGDSFSDLYSRLQQRIAFEPKHLVLAMGRPLFLLPQTYGPFSTDSARQAAIAILRQAASAWARDHDSYLALQALLGDAFDPVRHREGVDVAFRLPSTPPSQPLPEPLATWLDSRQSVPVAGLNVSGLLYDTEARARYGLAGSYRALTHALVRRLLEDTDANLVLVPHVVGGNGSDEQAAADVHGTLPSRDRHRVCIAPPPHAPGEAKWLIAQLDWFCGARMHATIAALSSGVPTVALAYSLKTRGVFASCGLGEEVADLRRADERAVLAQLMRSWQRRTAVRERLTGHLPRVLAAADEQAHELATTLRATGESSARPARRMVVG